MRYRRQIQFTPIGTEGQNRLESARVLVVGLGALGSAIAEQLTRAGIGKLKIVDRDWVELDNLPRQTLYTEADVTERLPKAIAASNHLQAINGVCQIESHVKDVTYETLPELARDVDLILDGTDNFETRMLLNDYSLAKRTPWVHGGCLGASGQCMLVVPGETACFRCLMPDVPPAGSFETCNTAGVMGAAVSIIANWQSILAIQYLVAPKANHKSELISIEMWNPKLHRMSAPREKLSTHCPACSGKYEFLDGTRHQSATALCGKNAVQIQPPVRDTKIDLPDLKDRLSELGTVEQNPFFVRLKTTDHEITLFRDGRAIISGTEDPVIAKRVYVELIGS